MSKACALLCNMEGSRLSRIFPEHPRVVNPRHLIEGLLQAVVNLHSRNIMHRDLKPENMVDKDGSLAICDLGSAKVIERLPAAVDFEEIASPVPTWDLTHGVTTLPYAAPEMLEYKPHGLPVDLWAIG